MTTTTTQSLAQTILSTRRTWKTLGSKGGEPVWPPELERALIEGLEKYRPPSLRQPSPGSSSERKGKELQRFPKRNRWISEYILKTTGKRRTPKQVGSRIQMLGERCEEENVQRLLKKKEWSPEPEPDPLEAMSSTFFSAPSPPVESTCPSRSVLVEITPAENPCPASPLSTHHHRIILQTSPMKPLHTQSPITSFTTSFPITNVNEYTSVFRIYVDGVCLHTESTTIFPLAQRECAYGTYMVPSYWSYLCTFLLEGKQCTLVQDIIGKRKLLEMVYEFDVHPSLLHCQWVDGYTYPWVWPPTEDTYMNIFGYESVFDFAVSNNAFY